MLTHILDGQDRLVSLLGELGPHVLVVGHVGVCLEVQFAPLVFEASVSPLRSFLDFLEEFCRH